ncbi:protein SMG7 [Ixodes scapularis]|nr:protein SMG7 [Ixodes scapularis]
MKASVSQILKEVESVKMALAEDSPRNARAFQLRTRLCWLLEELLLTDLEFALDKKVEQELWNSAFRSPIAAFQLKASDKKEHQNGEVQTMLSTLLETASGFYLQLLQKLCCVYDVSLRCHLKDSNFGILHLDRHDDLNAEKPKKSSVLYICQHCLVHLGDIARYRSQSLQAENFYRHAVELGPRNGHPYNQLALLEAASGEKLSAVFFHVRSLALQHPFPAAATNLSKLYSKMVSDSSASIGKTKMSPYEYTTAFLQFHAHIYLVADLKRAEGLLGSLTACLPALVIAEKLDTWQLLQMVAVSMFGHQHCARHHRGSPRTLPESGEAAADGRPEEGPAALPRERARALQLLLDFVASMLHAFLLPMHALQDPRDMRDCCSVPVVKLILDWLLHKQDLLHGEAFVRKPQIWHGFCKLLNALVTVLPADLAKEKFMKVPLPEDWDLQCFLPLQEAHRKLHFDNGSPILSKADTSDLRASRLLDLAEMLGRVIMTGKSLITVSSDEPPKYTASHYTEAMSNQVMQQIQELAIDPEADPRKQGVSSLASPCEKGPGSDGGPVPEVRFKLEAEGQLGKVNDAGKRKDRRPTRNAAMQAIFQQREQRGTPVVMDNHGARRPTTNEMLLPTQNNHHMDDKPEHMRWHQQPQSFQHAVGNGGIGSGRVNMPYLPTNGRPPQPLGGPTPPLTFDPGVAQIPPPQQPPHLGVGAGGGGVQQTPPFLTGTAVPGTGPGPSYLWNYFVPGGQLAQPAAPQQSPMVPRMPPTHGPPPFMYLGANGPHQAAAPTMAHLETLLRQQQQSVAEAEAKLAGEHFQQHQQQHPAVAGGGSQPPWVPPHLIEVNGCQMMPSGTAQQPSASDLSANTYSLFNSPWPSGLQHMAKDGGRSAAGAIDPMVMHSRIQSLWSGPGPSPLERLLEQQKQWRDGATQ